MKVGVGCENRGRDTPPDCSRALYAQPAPSARSPPAPPPHFESALARTRSGNQFCARADGSRAEDFIVAPTPFRAPCARDLGTLHPTNACARPSATASSGVGKVPAFRAGAGARAGRRLSVKGRESNREANRDRGSLSRSYLQRELATRLRSSSALRSRRPARAPAPARNAGTFPTPELAVADGLALALLGEECPGHAHTVRERGGGHDEVFRP